MAHCVIGLHWLRHVHVHTPSTIEADTPLPLQTATPQAAAVEGDQVLGAAVESGVVVVDGVGATVVGWI